MDRSEKKKENDSRKSRGSRVEAKPDSTGRAESWAKKGCEAEVSKLDLGFGRCMHV